MSRLFRFSLLLFLLSLVFPSYAVKFNLPAYRWPKKKCLWNPVHDNTLVIVTANISPGPNQRTDVEIIDSSPQQNVYLRKKGIKAETRLAVTTHSDGEVGVCFYNFLENSQYNIHTYFAALCSNAGVDVPDSEIKNKFRTIDLDVDIGADAVDYKSVGSTWQHDSNLNNVSQRHRESGISFRPRNGDAKAGGLGERNCGRNGVPQEARRAFRQHEQYDSNSVPHLRYELTGFNSVNKPTSTKFCLVHPCGTRWPWDLADFTSQGFLQA